MNKDQTVILAAIALVVAPVFTAARLTGPINERRADLQLTATAEVTENLPPEIALTTTALGSFRGLAVDYLWYRANMLQGEGQYYEAIQLSDWITKLQPRFPRVWAFHAWNMAYNISDAVHTPEEKWMWVREGIRLLRQKAIPLNPQSVILHQELAWILFHKVGKNAVGAHWYYKRQFAEEWQALLGVPPDGSSQESIKAFRRIADAPDRVTDLIRIEPGLEREIQQLNAMGFKLDLEWLRRVHLLQATERWAPAPLPKEPEAESDPNQRLLAWLRDPQRKLQRTALLAFARKQALIREYNMDPKIMLELMHDFGPMDWRHPAAHSVYWAIRGARLSEHRKGEDLFDVLQTDRNLLYALQTLAFSGRLHFDPLTGYYSQVADLRLLDGYEKALKEVSRRQGKDGQTPRELKDSHRGFLEWATRECYLFGSRAKAEAYYQRLRETYGRESTGGAATDQGYTAPLQDFVLDQIKRGSGRLDQVQGAINLLLRRAFLEIFAERDEQRGQRSRNRARALYQEYQRSQAHVNPGERKANELPPLPNMEMDASVDVLTDRVSVVPVTVKMSLWRGLPESFRLAIYDRCKEALRAAAQGQGYDPEKAFPEPPGMEAYRKTREKAGAQDAGETPEAKIEKH